VEIYQIRKLQYIKGNNCQIGEAVYGMRENLCWSLIGQAAHLKYIKYKNI
jgi:hypothetical protein